MGYYPAPNAKTEKNPTPELYITHSLTHSLQKMETLGLSVKNSKHKYTFQFAHCNFHAIFNHFPTHWIRPSMGWHFWISFRYRFLANIIYIYIYYIYIEGGVKSILLRWLIVWPVRFGDEFSPLPQCCWIANPTRTETSTDQVFLFMQFGTHSRFGKAEKQDDEARRTPKSLWCAACFSMSPPIFPFGAKAHRRLSPKLLELGSFPSAPKLHSWLPPVHAAFRPLGTAAPPMAPRHPSSVKTADARGSVSVSMGTRRQVT